MLSGRTTHDLDFVLDGGAIQAARKVAKGLQADFYPLDVERDTGRILLKQAPYGRMLIDFSSLRGLDLESDQRARDFTINAIAIDVRNPEDILDPLGGARDLLAKELKVCSPRTFEDDPIRILRAARLSNQFMLKILPETRQLLRSALPGMVDVSTERVRDELFRILDGEKPWNAIRLMDALGILPYVLPEIKGLQGVQQPPPHIHDVFDHTLLAMQKLGELIQTLGLEHEPEEGTNWAMGLASVRLGRYRTQLSAHLSARLNPDRSLLSLIYLASLYHDAGKPAAQTQDEAGTIHFYGHEGAGERLIRARAETLRLSQVEIDRLGQIVRHHMRPFGLSTQPGAVSRRAIYKFFRDTNSAGVDVCLASMADLLAAYGPAIPQDVWMGRLDVIRSLLEAYWESTAETISPPILLNGDDLMANFGLKPGPEIGRILAALREAQAAGEIHLRDEALDFARTQLTQG
jgi:tRNA nucleotidyltransferase/poly(A) polymerase